MVLASASPQRRAILDQLGIAHAAVDPGVAEVGEGEPRALVLENARRKARAVEGELVIGADTTVSIDDRILGKPRDEAEARAHLAALAGRSHDVWSGIAVRDEAGERTAAMRTRVTFRALEASTVEWYLATEEWRGRAGAYAIQGRGAALVEAIEGDYLTVVGLPVPALVGLVPDLLEAR